MQNAKSYLMRRFFGGMVKPIAAPPVASGYMTARSFGSSWTKCEKRRPEETDTKALRFGSLLRRTGKKRRFRPSSTPFRVRLESVPSCFPEMHGCIIVNGQGKAEVSVEALIRAQSGTGSGSQG